MKEDTPKPKRPLDIDGKPKPASGAPQKGKSIKVTVPLFPKNPEHPVPGMEKANAKKNRVPVRDEKKSEDKKKDKSALKKTELKPSGTLPKAKKIPGKAVPMFSKKTVANAVVKVPVKTLVKTILKKK